MRKQLSTILSACFWLTLLALVIAGITRLGVDAMERRTQHSVARLH
jgi:hypothetical protein